MRLAKISAAIVAALFLSGALLGAPEEDESQARAVLENYLTAWEFKDYPEMYSLLDEPSRKEMDVEAFRTRLTESGVYPVEHEVAKFFLEETQAKAWVTITLEEGLARRSEGKETIRLVKGEKGWQVVPLFPAPLPSPQVQAPKAPAPETLPGTSQTQEEPPATPKKVLPLSKVSVEEILKTMEARNRDIRDFEGRIILGQPESGQTVNFAGTISYKSPDKVLLKITAPAMFTICIDGKMVWIYLPQANTVSQSSAPFKEKDNLILGFGDVQATIRDRFEVSYGGDAQVEGQQAYMLILQPKAQKESLGIDRIELYVDSGTYFPVKNVAVRGGEEISILYQDVTTNVGLKDSDFEFEIPPDTNVTPLPLDSFF